MGVHGCLSGTPAATCATGLAPLLKGFLNAAGFPARRPSYLDVTGRETNFQAVAGALHGALKQKSSFGLRVCISTCLATYLKGMPRQLTITEMGC